MCQRGSSAFPSLHSPQGFSHEFSPGSRQNAVNSSLVPLLGGRGNRGNNRRYHGAYTYSRGFGPASAHIVDVEHLPIGRFTHSPTHSLVWRARSSGECMFFGPACGRRNEPHQHQQYRNGLLRLVWWSERLRQPHPDQRVAHPGQPLPSKPPRLDDGSQGCNARAPDCRGGIGRLGLVGGLHLRQGDKHRSRHVLCYKGDLLRGCWRTDQQRQVPVPAATDRLQPGGHCDMQVCVCMWGVCRGGGWGGTRPCSELCVVDAPPIHTPMHARTHTILQGHPCIRGLAGVFVFELSAGFA